MVRGIIRADEGIAHLRPREAPFELKPQRPVLCLKLNEYSF